MERLFLECAVRAVLIAAATAVVLRVMRAKTAAARHASWTAVVLLMLLLPVWTAWGPKATVLVLPPAPASVPTAFAVLASSSGPMPVQTSGLAWRRYLLGLYLLGAVSLLIRLAVGTIRAKRLTGASCVAPITVGLLRPRIILPERWRQWPQAQVDAVLTHEGEHVHRRDPLVQWLALLNRAVFWFHPLAWWLERRLSAFAEEACDAAVLERGHDPRDYSEYLLDLARSVERAGMRVNVVGMAMPGSFLPQRVKNIIDGVHAPRISRARLMCTVAGCVISSTVFAAGTLERAVRILPPPAQAATVHIMVQAPRNETRPDGQKSSVDLSRVRKGGVSSKLIPEDPPKLLVAQAQAQAQTAPAPVVTSPENPPFSFAIAFDYTHLNRAEYSVHIAVKIPGSFLEPARQRGAEQTSIDFFGEVKDEFSTTVSTVQDKVNIRQKLRTPSLTSRSGRLNIGES
jgi:hypothetical protein